MRDQHENLFLHLILLSRRGGPASAHDPKSCLSANTGRIEKTLHSTESFFSTIRRKDKDYGTELLMLL